MSTNNGKIGRPTGFDSETDPVKHPICQYSKNRPEGVTKISFVDDLSLVVTAKNKFNLMNITEISLERIPE